jgi:lipopolysaccharide transport system ATP-binding protein
MSLALKISGVSKIYRLGEIGTGTISRDLERWLTINIFRKEDPFLKLGEKNTRSEKGLSDIIYSLNNISFEVNQGDTIGIIGKNGAGKSTLLKIISRVTTPSLGKIQIKGRISSLLEVGTGFHPELTGRENIYLNGAILGMRKKEISAKLDEIIDFTGIERYIDTPVKRYSSGMYVRLAFAVAAHLEGEIMVVDEVLAVGDADFQKKCLGKMGDLSKNSGRTVLFVSHNMAAIQQLCSRTIVLSDGELSYNGKTNLAVKQYLSNSNYDNLSSERYIPEQNEKEFQLIYACIKNKDGLIQSTFECDEDIHIHLKIKIRKIIPGLYGYLRISNVESEIAVLVSDSNDIKMNLFDSSGLGLINVSIKIPRRTLGTGTYSVYLNFTSSYNLSTYNVDSPLYILSFSLQDNLTTRGNNREGFLSTLLEWKFDN